MYKAVAVVPNWNGADRLKACLDSLQSQSQEAHVIVVDNGSSDGSVALLEQKYPKVEVIRHEKNKGFSGGVNAGLRRAFELGVPYAALLNNDAVADKRWLEHLTDCLNSNDTVGIATSKILDKNGTAIDSTGDYYTIWGLPYPRGRGKSNLDAYDTQTDVFAASGGASLYRLDMLKQVGLFDEDFFAYYEDVDLSFRAQLAGWAIKYVPAAVVHHQIGATSGAIKGFATYQTLKNLPLLLWKNVPLRLLPRVWIRLVVAWSAFALRTLSRGQVWPFVKACLVGAVLWPKKLVERHRIQKNRKVSSDYIRQRLFYDLPPNARALRRLRSIWWKLTLRRSRP